MNDVLFIDLETQSAVPIRNVLEYVNHPSTRVLCAMAKRGNSVSKWVPKGRSPQDAFFTTSYPPFDPSIPWVAHNAYGFDALVWNRLYPQCRPVQWLDTIPMCRAARLPAALDKVSRLLFGEGKSDQASAIINAMCTAKYVGGKLWYPVGTPALWKQLLDYNTRDVELLERLWNVVLPYFREWDLLALDQRINERGVRFDKKLLTELIRAWSELQEDTFAHIAELTDGELTGTDLRSNTKVTRWLYGKGIDLSTLNKFHLEEQLAQYDEIDPVVLEVLKARQTVTRGSKGKVERLLEIAAVSDDRLRHSLVFHGGHTGRWSGRGVQPQNLARITNAERVRKTFDYFDSTGQLVNCDSDLLTELTRGVFIASPGNKLIIADYSAIEARGIAWLAGEENLLKAFRDPARDVYREMASVLQAPRQLGKVVVLGANYGMGWKKLDTFCKLAKPKIDLVALGLQVENVVKTYRQQIPAIVSFWHTLERFCLDAVNGKITTYNRLTIYRQGSELRITLPSGRELIYRNIRVEDRVPAYVAIYNMASHTKPTLIYDHPHGYSGVLYGGLLAENVTQATCRDVFAECALLRADAAGYPAVMHGHDSVLYDVPESTPVEPLRRVLLELPEWATGFPLRVDIHEGNRYCV